MQQFTDFSYFKIDTKINPCMSATTTCPNCNNVFTGAFCNGSGQKITHRITMNHMLHDAMHVFTHTDKGFFHMFLQLFYKPGIVAHEYILGGKRKRYFCLFSIWCSYLP